MFKHWILDLYSSGDIDASNTSHSIAHYISSAFKNDMILFVVALDNVSLLRTAAMILLWLVVGIGTFGVVSVQD